MLACIVFSSDLAGEVLSCKMILVPLWRFRRQLVRLLFKKLLRIRLVDLLAFGRRDTVLTPLPQLGSTDFGSCSVLLKHRHRCQSMRKLMVGMSYHQIIDWDATNSL